MNVRISAGYSTWPKLTLMSRTGAATGFIFYPGAKVPAAAYAPAAQAIANAGYPTYIADMPLALAILDGNAAADIQAAHPEVTTWVTGGHSLGGVMAAGYAADHRDTVDGLALWASYPSEDILGADLVTSSIFGTLDAGMERMTSAETKAKLPAATTFVPIEGGNHEQVHGLVCRPAERPARDHLASGAAGPGGGRHTRRPGSRRALDGAGLARRAVGAYDPLGTQARTRP